MPKSIGLSAIISPNIVKGILTAQMIIAISFSPALADMVTFSVPNASETGAAAINDAGWVAGSAIIGGYDFGFVRTPDGSFTTFQAGDAGYQTATWGMNTSGEVVGTTFSPGNAAFFGFVRAVDGTITTFDPGGTAKTFAFAINDLGAITGYFISDTGHGYVRAADGSVETFDVPNAAGTEPAVINGAGQIAGIYYDKHNKTHGFIRNANGEINTFDVPGCVKIYVSGINSSGDVVGDCSGRGFEYGFLRLNDGSSVDISDHSKELGASAINNGGVVVGAIVGDATIQGYIRAEDGTLKKINAIKQPRYTVPTAINNNGVVAGWYESNRVQFGFVYTPKK